MCDSACVRVCVCIVYVCMCMWVYVRLYILVYPPATRWEVREEEQNWGSAKAEVVYLR